jgi:hypothetical protein
MKRKEREIREMDPATYESRTRSLRAALSAALMVFRVTSGFSRYQRLTLRPCATCTHEIDATQPIGDVVAQFVEIRCGH